jgi:hypothetical protein
VIVSRPAGSGSYEFACPNEKSNTPVIDRAQAMSIEEGTSKRVALNLRFAIRVIFVVIQLVLVYWFDQHREIFFYQGF